uniref:Uncharacterized protein n=1 Tax=Cacopsylla melanoneura TaxID=428564 RepID=A0A8D8PYK6_9HEMI
MSYGCVYWGFSVNSNEIFILQKRAIRTIFSNKSCKPVFKEKKILTYYGQVILDTCVILHKNFDKVTKHSDQHRHDTRNKNKIIISNTCKRSFLNKGVILYNNLSEELRQKPLALFQKVLKEQLLIAAPYSIQEFLQWH